MTLPTCLFRPALGAVSRALRSAGAGVCAAALAGCASGPPTPDWQINAHAASRKAVQASLSGHSRVAELEWRRARAETARTAQPAALARLALLRCATDVASLVLQPCADFEIVRADASAPERAYADYLAGQGARMPAESIALLPPAQRQVLVAGDGAEGALRAINDPLARLVAAGVLLNTGRASPGVLSLAVDTASAQGWRRPLMAWLVLQRRAAEAAGDGAAQAAVQRRLDALDLSADLR